MGILLAAAMAVMATPARALVEHPESEWTPDVNLGPAPAAVGRWAYADYPYYNASAVAIGPKDAPTGYLTDYVITVRHQGGGIGNGVNFGNVDYSVYDEFVNPTADLRIVRIRSSSGPAALANWAAPYTGTNEATRTAVIGGFGRARGTEYATYYSWAAADNPPVQRWGQNKVESFSDGLQSSSLFGETYKSNVLIAYFDDYNVGSYVQYESAVAEYDSGGGWFLRDATTGAWQVAGLSAYVANGTYGKSYFSGGAVQGQYPIRIGSYAKWIDAVFKRSTWQFTTGGWADAANWSAGVPSGIDKFAVLTNTLSDSRTVTVSNATPFGTIRFDSLGNYTIDSTGPGQLVCQATIGAGAIEVYGANGAGSHTITAPIKLTSSLVINQTSTSALLTLAGPITTPIGPKTGLIKAGAGTLVLSGSSTFSGGLEIQKGTVRVMSAGALGTPSTDPGVTLKAAGLDFRTDADLTFTHSVKVTTLTGSTVTSTLNVDRLTAGTGRSVTLGSLTTDGAVTLNVTSVTGCSAAFSGAASFTNLGSSGVATINTAGADLALTGGLSLASGTLTKSGPKMLTLSGTQTYGSGTTLKVSGGTLALNADAGSASAANLAVTANNSSAVTFGASQHLAGLSLTGGSASLAASQGVLVTSALSINTVTSCLDLGDGAMILNYSGASPLAQVQAWVASGENLYGQDPTRGFFGGNGITSSAAAADPDYLHAVGVIDNNHEGTRVYETWHGQPVGLNSILVAYTYFGDALLTGDVDSVSYAMIDNGYNAGLTGWVNGDFNYDGAVDSVDYALIDNVYNTLHGGSGAGSVSPLGAVPDPATPGLMALGLDTLSGGDSSAIGALPEPATLALLGLGAACLAARRRTRRWFRRWGREGRIRAYQHPGGVPLIPPGRPLKAP